MDEQQLEAQLQNEAGRTQDFRRGESFLEKRDAKFGGRGTTYSEKGGLR